PWAARACGHAAGGGLAFAAGVPFGGTRQVRRSKQCGGLARTLDGLQCLPPQGGRGATMRTDRFWYSGGPKLYSACIRRVAGRRNAQGSWIVTKEYTVVIERDEQGYLIGSVPELQGCHTQARSMDDLLQRIREAI